MSLKEEFKQLKIIFLEMKEKIKKYPAVKHAVLHSWENNEVVQKLIKIVEY
ncbi:MAG: hypothetical protein ACI82Z_001452 [Cellvibrionaceae bacterium]